MNYISKNFLDTNNDLTLLFSTRPDLEFFTTVEPFDPNEEALFPDLSNSPASSDMSNSTTESTSTPSNHHENRLDFFHCQIVLVILSDHLNILQNKPKYSKSFTVKFCC